VNGSTLIGLLTSSPYIIACVGMIVVTRLSDRSGDRKSYLLGCMIASALGYLLACFYADNSVAMMGALVLATAGTFIAIPLFWTLPQSTFSGLAIATGTAAINSLGQLSGISYMGMLSIAPLILLSVVLIAVFVKNPPRSH